MKVYSRKCEEEDPIEYSEHRLSSQQVCCVVDIGDNSSWLLLSLAFDSSAIALRFKALRRSLLESLSLNGVGYPDRPLRLGFRRFLFLDMTTSRE